MRAPLRQPGDTYLRTWFPPRGETADRGDRNDEIADVTEDNRHRERQRRRREQAQDARPAEEVAARKHQDRPCGHAEHGH